MDISTQMSATQQSRVEEQVQAFNDSMPNEAQGRQQDLGRDDFLRILLTQLQNQDPTEPMKDKEFIGQMAQFSSLEQMTNMADNFKQLSGMLSGEQAMNTIGRTVEVSRGDETIEGSVTEVSRGDTPQVMVDGHYYDYADVIRVKE
ncbi:MAG: flagellar hook assembly protein FlgD [Spirochaetia bacterium]